MGFFDGIRRLMSPTPVYLIQDGVGNVHVMDMDNASLYRTQPNLQAVVTFIADNVAQLPLKLYVKGPDGERDRVTDGTAASLIGRPNEWMTTYEWVRTVVTDYCVYGRSVNIVVPDTEAPSGYVMVPVPATWITNVRSENSFQVSSVDVCARNGGSAVRIPASNLLIFSTYSPTSPAGCTSPLESLKQTLNEQMEADRYRLGVWRNGGKASSYIKRPKDVQPWTPETAAMFKRDFKSAWTGDGSDIGGVPVLEDGMEIVTLQMNSRESQWAEAKKLSREEVAGVYHINPSLIWHTDGQTYASAKDNARALYNDCLAPMLQMMQQRITTFLLPRLGEQVGMYAEFDMQEKLRGSFEEQARIFQTMVGGPIMTRSEARQRLNLPRLDMDGMDDLIVPLNVVTGGQASPTDSGSQNVGGESANVMAYAKSKRDIVRMKSSAQDDDADGMSDAFRAFFKRQARSVLPKIGAKLDGGFFDIDRWNKELSDDIEPHIAKSVSKMGAEFMSQVCEGEFSDEMTVNYVRKMAENRANAINSGTLKKLLSAMDAGDDGTEGSTPAGVFEELSNRSDGYGKSLANASCAFALAEAVGQARSAGYSTSGAMKTWIVTSGNPRASHASMNGETVPYDDEFSNGARWPGDIQLDPDESCNCQCQVEIVIP